MQNTEEIRPFTIDVPQADLADLRDRLARTRLPDQAPDAPWAYVLPAGQRDPYAVYELLHTLELADVKIERATAPLTARAGETPMDLPP